MLVSIVYALVCLIVDLAFLHLRSDRGRAVELLTLRQEVRVLRRQTRRPAWQPGDRLVLATLSRCLPRTDWFRFPGRPETLRPARTGDPAGPTPGRPVLASVPPGAGGRGARL